MMLPGIHFFLSCMRQISGYSSVVFADAMIHMRFARRETYIFMSSPSLQLLRLLGAVELALHLLAASLDIVVIEDLGIPGRLSATVSVSNC